MKQAEIIEKYKLDVKDFISFLDRKDYKYFKSMKGHLIVDDCDIDRYVTEYLAEKDWEEHAEERARQEAEAFAREAEKQAKEKLEAAMKKKAMAEMLITSGFNFDGYRITKYSGYISGDDAISVDRGISFLGFGGEGARDELMKSLSKIRRNALRELKEAAYDLGCNAVIGVDFDYITLDPQTHNIGGGKVLQPYVFGVTANGNAVIIEKIEE